MERKVNLESVDSSSVASLYTIFFENSDMSEFNKFMNRFKNDGKLKHDYQLILNVLHRILENGVQERYFRPEGKMSNRVCALPVMTGKLRLYCLRISDKILILGNGGIKESRTYNENAELNGYVMDLQKFDTILKAAEMDGSVTVEETVISGDLSFII